MDKVLESIQQQVHSFGILSRDYYDTQRTGLRFEGSSPDQGDYTKFFRGKVLYMTLGDMSEQVGSIMYSYYPKNTPEEELGEVFGDFEIVNRENTLYIDYVQIMSDFRGKRAHLSDYDEAGVSYATLMVTEFLRRAFTKPQIDTVFLWISTANPLGALTTYLNAGLYNNITVKQRLSGENKLLFYTATASQREGLTLSQERPRKTARSKATVFREQALGIDPAEINAKYSVEQVATSTTAKTPEIKLQLLETKGRQPLLVSLVKSYKSFTIGDILHEEGSKRFDEEELGKMYYLLIIETVIATLRQLGSQGIPVEFSFSAARVPAVDYIDAAFIETMEQGLVRSVTMDGPKTFIIELIHPTTDPQDPDKLQAVVESRLLTEQSMCMALRAGGIVMLEETVQALFHAISGYKDYEDKLKKQLRTLDVALKGLSVEEKSSIRSRLETEMRYLRSLIDTMVDAGDRALTDLKMLKQQPGDLVQSHPYVQEIKQANKDIMKGVRETEKTIMDRIWNEFIKNTDYTNMFDSIVPPREVVLTRTK